MSREWKPGDVATVPSFGVVVADPSGRWRTLSDGQLLSTPWRECAGYTMFPDVRPLAVIDPEDREAAFRLIDLYFSGGADDLNAGQMQRALRELANPTPRIEEPTGLGAVVEDAGGFRYVRSDVQTSNPWRDPRGIPHEWSDINATCVLSEGVKAGESE